MIGEIALNMYHAVALGAVLYWLGGVLVSKIQPLSRWCIPAPLAGGLCFALLNLALYASGTGYITFDKTLQTTFQNLFFTTVGFTVSIPALRRGGRSVALVLLLAAVLAPIQNLLGGGVMVLFGQSPLMGIAIGSTALVGGPATAAAYGADLAALENQVAACRAEEAACGSDYVRLQEVQTRLKELEAALEEKTERWMYLNELKEKIDNGG